jgi:hypothetical protein
VSAVWTERSAVGSLRVGMRIGQTSLLVALCACAAPEKTDAGTLPVFAETEAAFFDDGVDLVRDPQGVGGLWQEEWERELGERVARGDFVALGRVHTLRTDQDLDRRTSYRIVLSVERTLRGEAPAGDLTLVSREGARGYASVHGNHDRVLEQRFVVFARRYRDAVGAIVTHWHLSPASDAVLKLVNAKLEEASPTFHEVHVIERRE